jgi:hypothetical protein
MADHVEIKHRDRFSIEEGILHSELSRRVPIFTVAMKTSRAETFLLACSANFLASSSR